MVFALGLLASGVRFRSRVLVGTGDDPDALLKRLVRAHGNSAEYAPMLAVLFLVHGARQAATEVLWLICGATAARVLMVVGLLTARTLCRPSPLRLMGALGTYLFGIGLSFRLVAGS